MARRSPTSAPALAPGVASGDISPSSVAALAEVFSAIDLTGAGPPEPPWGAAPTAEAFGQALASGVDALPLVYRDAYIVPLQQALPRLLLLTAQQGGSDPAETLLGAIYGHAADSPVAGSLRRFLTVVSDLYRSFLDKEKRAKLMVQLSQQLPPLATFRHDGSLGPYTFPCDVVSAITGGTVGVVSMPSTYRDQPLMWGSLAHEVGGHDVLHADAGLLDELAAQVRGMFSALGPSWGQYAGVAQLLGQLWTYWIDEAASDVYGVLNLGPSFALNFVPWLAALRYRFGQTQLPNVLTWSGANATGMLDTHPTDILRIHVAIGAVANLAALNASSRRTYLSALQQVADLAAGAAQTVTIRGELPMGGAVMPVDVTLPLPLMQYAAALVGSCIAATPLQTFQGRSIQLIETWDDGDEMVAQRAADHFRHQSLLAFSADAAHMMAGATLAVLSRPEAASDISAQLGEALDQALDRDPLWGPPRQDLWILPPIGHPGRPC